MKRKIIFFACTAVLMLACLTGAAQKYTDGTRLLKGAEVLSATPLQLDYVLEKLADTAKITVNLHEGKTHLVLNDGSGKWREWWYYMGKWQPKMASDLPAASYSELGGVRVLDNSDISIDKYGWISTKYNKNKVEYVCINIDSGDDSNDGSPEKPVKSLEKAISMIYSKGTVFVYRDNSHPMIDIPVGRIYIGGKDINIMLHHASIRKVNFTASTGDSYIKCQNSKLNISKGLSNASIVDFSINGLVLDNSDCYVEGNLKVGYFNFDRTTLFVSDRFWIDVEQLSTIHELKNRLINCLIKCSEFNSVNSAGENSPIYNRGGTVLAGKEILLPGDKI